MYILNIKPYIKEKKISQYKMAQDLGWSPAYLSLFINNKTAVTLENLEKITKYLNLSLFDVIDDVNEGTGERQGITTSHRMSCPHCGKELNITLRVE